MTPTTIQTSSVYNVEASLNAYMRAQLALITRPSWLPALPEVVSIPLEDRPKLPAFSFTHLPVGMYDRWQGRAVDSGLKGQRAIAIFEVDCWVTRASDNWQAQLRTMKDMVLTVLNRAGEVVVYDYAANQSNPTATSYLVRWEDVSMPQTAPDVNPDIERARILATYAWVYRS